MSLVAASPSPRNDRAFLIALGIVIAFGGAEVIATAIHFGGKWRAAHVAAAKSVPAPTTIPSATPPARVSPLPSVAKNVPPAAATQSATDLLLQEARGLKDKGDTANALARLQQAAQREPQNAPVLAEMAGIYESIGLLDRSNETWRKIQELGPASGELYQVAEAKLKTGVSGNAMAPRPVTDNAGAPLDSEGLPEGSFFGVAGVAMEEAADPDAETDFRLKIAIKKRAGVPIDPSKLRIMVLFYDTVDDDKIVPTDADVGSEWVNPKHDWIDTNPETLIVTYLRSRTHAMTSEAAISAAAAAVTPGKKSGRAGRRGEEENSVEAVGHRKYLGYVIRILYNDKVQTVKADPARLLRDAPDLSATP